MFKLRNGSKGGSNPGSLDCESGILPLSYHLDRMVEAVGIPLEAVVIDTRVVDVDFKRPKKYSIVCRAHKPMSIATGQSHPQDSCRVKSSGPTTVATDTN